MQATIPMNALRAALRHVPKKDHRPALAGVTIQRIALRAAVMGTDGYTLFAQWVDAEPEPGCEGAVIVPRETVEAVVKLGRGAEHVQIADGRIIAGAANLEFTPVDAAPIRWSAVWPAETGPATDPLPGSWNWALLAHAQETLGTALGWPPAKAKGAITAVRVSPGGVALVQHAGLPNAGVIVMPRHRRPSDPEALVGHLPLPAGIGE